MEFHHPYFIKDKEQFLEYIKRKVPDIKLQHQQGTGQIFSINQAQQALQLNQLNQLNQQQQLSTTTHNPLQNTLQNNKINNNSQVSLKQFPQLIKPDEINKVLDDVNVIKTKQKLVDESLFAVKK